ncbi:MAG: hypothetical protein KC800_01320 [Candidatus Eremiobacteraeota bacterium]|nr:hypothetical protein [Candidatus Eremiobacteraeota bacterium]
MKSEAIRELVVLYAQNYPLLLLLFFLLIVWTSIRVARAYSAYKGIEPRRERDFFVQLFEELEAGKSTPEALQVSLARNKLTYGDANMVAGILFDQEREGKLLEALEKAGISKSTLSRLEEFECKTLSVESLRPLYDAIKIQRKQAWKPLRRELVLHFWVIVLTLVTLVSPWLVWKAVVVGRR